MVSRRAVLGAGTTAAGVVAVGGYVAWAGDGTRSGPELGTVEFFPPTSGGRRRR